MLFYYTYPTAIILHPLTMQNIFTCFFFLLQLLIYKSFTYFYRITIFDFCTIKILRQWRPLEVAVTSHPIQFIDTASIL